LKEFHQKIAKLKFLDPACGCGNFLIIAYREIRKLEIEILKILYTKNIEEEGEVFDIETMSLIDVDNFYGIEISEFPAKISEVALWLMDHLMNMELGAAFGRLFERIPLKKSAVIKNENALTYNWNNIINQKELSYILGNPPFVGARMKSPEQSAEMKTVFNNMKSCGDLDYVCAWYKKACEFIKGTKIKVAFVSTNSITQGTQVGILWKCLINKYGVHIHFAHRTFMWYNEAKGKAHVYCVIIGFACFDTDKKRLFDYEDVKGEPHEVKVENINPYLVDFKNIFINSRTEPICKVPKMHIGNKPIDDGNYLFSKEEMKQFIKKEPNSKKYFYKWTGSKQFINNQTDYVLLASRIPPHELKKMPLVIQRVKNVMEFRKKSDSEPTREIAEYPTKFHIEIFPKHNYLLFPRVSTSRRKYIPIGFMSKKIIAGDSCLIIENANLYYFGVLTSIMHMTWTKYVCGRLGNGYRYSKDIVYNNFPFPINPNKSIAKRIENKAQKILDIRGKYKDSSLGDLYDPLTMPADLFKAHNELDKAVDLAYGKTNLKNETERMKFIFELYESYINPLTYKK
ncbi:class I SAM-dependent DNA methyltransferase, partial [Brachyspira sp.]|uniref:class I SAM-dependent DNA methyltransferase n=1 Tax=Brachyspira sp. TaxID=1977261 RepID=UPI003D7D30A4